MRTWFPLAALFLAGWFGGGVALAQPAKTARTVQDDLGLFSAEAKAKANAEIARIKKDHHKDLMVETAHPPKQPKDLDFNDNPAVDRFIDSWAKDKFKNEQINGVHVLIIAENKLHKLRVGVGAETLKEGLFTNINRDELLRKIQEMLKAGDKNGALLAATGYVADAMQRNGRSAVSAVPPTKAPPPANAPPPEQVVHQQPQPVQASPIFYWILIGLGVLLIFWLVSAIIRGFASMGGGGGYGYGGGGYGPGYGGGGGFMSGMLGGMFGAAAGMWMYNHFLGSGTPSAWGGSPGPSGGGPSAVEPTDVGAGDPSIGGADYGDVDKGAIEAPDDGGGGGGGGDWGGGGGDAGGGGDWGGGGGGGDWGGGGGGGGGGDW